MPSPPQTRTSSTGVENRGTNDRGVSDRGTRTSPTAAAQAPEPAANLKSEPTWVPKYTEGVNHDHQPSGKWDELKQEPDSAFLVELNVKFKSPGEAAEAARYWELSDMPLAAKHFDYYLAGSGKDFVEDEHLDAMLRTDEGVMYLVGKHIRSRQRPSSTVVESFLELLQNKHYLIDEFAYSFGSIDRLDYKADLQNNTLRVWFKDRYEWHPYYPHIYPPKEGDDKKRPSNIVHAALVELKTEGAKDFWMVGKAEVPLGPVLQIGSMDRPPSLGAIRGDTRSEGNEGIKM